MEGRRVLVATDLSDNSKPAAKAGRDLADELGLELHVVHVFELSGRGAYKKMKIFHDPELKKRAEDRVEEWFLDIAGVTPDSVTVLAGNPAPEIHALASYKDVACLVIAMSGRGAWNRFVFGSTATRLAGRPPCITMVVHPEYHRIEHGMTLGLGTDFSSPSDVALDEATWLARRFDSVLRVVHANVLPSTTVIHEGELPEGMEGTEVINWARDAMDTFLGRHEEKLEGLDCRSSVVTEHPVSGLRSFVEEQGIDWMILGDRRPDERQGAAPVKGKWVQQMNCSTIIVPSRKASENVE